MSEFNDDFYTEGSKDLSESEKQNKYKDSNNDGKTDDGRPVVEYMTKIQANGMILCDDLFARDGNIFSKDGTNLESLIKQASMVKIIERSQSAWNKLTEVYNATIAEIAMLDAMMWQSHQAESGGGVEFTNYRFFTMGLDEIGPSMMASYLPTPGGSMPSEGELKGDFLDLLDADESELLAEPAPVSVGDMLSGHERDLEDVRNFNGSKFHGFLGGRITGNESDGYGPGFGSFHWEASHQDNRDEMMEKRQLLVDLADRLVSIGKEMLGSASPLKINNWKEVRFDPFDDGQDLTVHIRLLTTDYVADAGAASKFETFLEVKGFSYTQHSLKGTNFFASRQAILTPPPAVGTLQINVGEFAPKHAIKALYPNGEYRYHEVKPLNDMLQILDADGKVESIPEAVQQINRLGQIVSEVVGHEQFARYSRFSDLEEALKSYFKDTANSAVSLEEELRSFASVRDVAVMAAADDAVDDLASDIRGAYNQDHGFATATFTDAAAGVNFDFPIPVDSNHERLAGYWQAQIAQADADELAIDSAITQNAADQAEVQATFEACMEEAEDAGFGENECGEARDAAIAELQEELAELQAEKQKLVSHREDYLLPKYQLALSESRFNPATWIIKAHVIKGWETFVSLQADVVEKQQLIEELQQAIDQASDEIAQGSATKQQAEADIYFLDTQVIPQVQALMDAYDDGEEICEPSLSGDGSLVVVLPFGDAMVDKGFSPVAEIPCDDNDHGGDLYTVLTALEDEQLVTLPALIAELVADIEALTAQMQVDQVALAQAQSDKQAAELGIANYQAKLENPIIWKQASMVVPTDTNIKTLRVEVLAEACGDVYLGDGILCTVAYAGSVNDIDYEREMQRGSIHDLYPAGGVVPTLNEVWEEDASDGSTTPLVVANPNAVHQADVLALSQYTFGELSGMVGAEISLDGDAGVQATVLMPTGTPVPSVVKVAAGGELTLLRQDSWGDGWNGYSFKMTEILADGTAQSSQLIAEPSDLTCESLVVTVSTNSLLVFETEAVGQYAYEISIPLGKEISCGDVANEEVEEPEEGEDEGDAFVMSQEEYDDSWGAVDTLEGTFSYYFAILNEQGDLLSLGAEQACNLLQLLTTAEDNSDVMTLHEQHGNLQDAAAYACTTLTGAMDSGGEKTPFENVSFVPDGDMVALNLGPALAESGGIMTNGNFHISGNGWSWDIPGEFLTTNEEETIVYVQQETLQYYTIGHDPSNEDMPPSDAVYIDHSAMDNGQVSSVPALLTELDVGEDSTVYILVDNT